MTRDRSALPCRAPAARRLALRRAGARAVLAAGCLVLAGPAALLAQDGSALRPPAEVTALRQRDRVVRTDGRTLEVTVVGDADLALQDSITVRSGSTEYTIPTGEIERIVRRRSPGDVLEDWREWIARELGERGPRARAELELARWCLLPHPELGGRPPVPSAAREHLERAVHLDPGLEDAWRWLVALSTRDVAVEIAPRERLDREVGLWLLARQAGADLPVMNWRLGAILCRRLGRWDAARPYLEAVVRDPGAAPGPRREARALLSESLLRSGRGEDAVALWEEALDAAGDPPPFEPLWRLGRVHLRLGGPGHIESALELLARAREIDPGWHDVLVDLAAAEAARGWLARADELLGRFLEARPGHGPALVDRALVQVRLGRPEQAVELLGEVEETEGTVAARAATVRALVAEARGDPAGAARSYARALELDPDLDEARLLLAASAARRGDPGAARREAEAIRKRAEARPALWVAGARILAAAETASGETERAATLLDDAARAAPSDPVLLERAGLALLAADRPRRAAELLEGALALGPGRVGARAGLAWLRYEAGDRAAAGDHLRRAREALAAGTGTAPEPPDRAALREWLDGALRRLRDLETLEVWRDAFEGEDAPAVDGWDEVELHGVSVFRRDGRAVFEGTQSNTPGGETGIFLRRPVERRTFARIAVRVRIDRSPCRPALVLAPAGEDGRGTGGVRLRRSADGHAVVEVRDAREGWAALRPGEPEDAAGRPRIRRRDDSGVEVHPDVPWPDDGAFHRLEIRRSTGEHGREDDGGRRRRRRERALRLELRLDGRTVARGVEAPGLSGPELRAGITGSADALGTAWGFTADEFEIYRTARRQAGRGPRGGG